MPRRPPRPRASPRRQPGCEGRSGQEADRRQGEPREAERQASQADRGQASARRQGRARESEAEQSCAFHARRDGGEGRRRGRTKSSAAEVQTEGRRLAARRAAIAGSPRARAAERALQGPGAGKPRSPRRLGRRSLAGAVAPTRSGVRLLRVLRRKQSSLPSRSGPKGDRRVRGRAAIPAWSQPSARTGAQAADPGPMPSGRCAARSRRRRSSPPSPPSSSRWRLRPQPRWHPRRLRRKRLQPRARTGRPLPRRSDRAPPTPPVQPARIPSRARAGHPRAARGQGRPRGHADGRGQVAHVSAHGLRAPRRDRRRVAAARAHERSAGQAPPHRLRRRTPRLDRDRQAEARHARAHRPR